MHRRLTVGSNFELPCEIVMGLRRARATLMWLVMALLWPLTAPHAAERGVPSAPTTVVAHTTGSALALPAATQHWLATKTVLSVGVGPEWLPIDGLDAGGKQTGLSAEVLARVAATLGVQVRAVRFDNYQQALLACAHGDIDLLSAITRTPERERTLRFTKSYFEAPVAYIGRRGALTGTQVSDLGGQRFVVERGYPSAEVLAQLFPRAELIEVDNTQQALQAVAQGRADVYRGALPPAHYVIEHDRLANLEVLSAGAQDTTALRFATASDTLREALDAALDAIGPQAIDAIVRAWQPQFLALTPPVAGLPTSRGASAGGGAALGEVRVAYDASFAPISNEERGQQAGGLAAEMFRRVADGAGLHYRFVAQPSFEDADNALRLREVDVVVAAVRTPERERYASFVGPWYSAPSAIVSQPTGGWPSIASLSGRVLAIDANHYLIPVIQRQYPGVVLKTVKTAPAVLQAVRDGVADAGITNVEVASKLIGRRFVGQLQVSGLVADNPSELSFMVRSDRPELAAALQSGFDAIPVNDRRLLENTYLRTNITVGMSRQDLLRVAAPVLAALAGLLLGVALYTYRLRRAQAQLRQERDQARAAADARAEFITEMGHDVRTPLASLASGLHLLTEHALPEPVRQLLAPLRRSADRTVDLLNHLLDHARMEAGHFEMHRRPTDLGALIKELVDHAVPSALAKGVTLTLAPLPDLPLLLMDTARTQQVLNNLLSNAVKFTAKGEVTVALSAKPLQADLWSLKLSVRDTGLGMSAQTQSQLFSRFSQAPGAHEHYGGTGLGMAITHRILQHAGGHIVVNSHLGVGSEFVVHVPARAAPSNALPGGTTGGAVLLVDDDPVNRLVYAQALRTRGFQVDTAESAATALTHLQQRRVDLLVTDLHLGGGMTGLELAAQVRADTPGWATHIVLLTGDDPPTTAQDGVDLWLQKARDAKDHAWLEALCALAGPRAVSLQP